VPNNFIPTGSEYFRILPEIILTLAGVLIMLLEGLSGDEDHPLTAPLTFAAIAASLVAAIAALGDQGAAFQRRVLRPVAVLACGAVPDGGGERADDDLHRTRDFVNRDVYHGGLSPR
jgi:hypothetical protein